MQEEIRGTRRGVNLFKKNGLDTKYTTDRKKYALRHIEAVALRHLSREKRVLLDAFSSNWYMR